MVLELRNPHSVLAALQTRPQAVLEIQLSADRPPGIWSEVIALAQEPTGVGFEVPAWLLALEEEVENQRTALLAHYTPSRLDERIPHRPLTYEEVMAQLDECDETE